MPVKPTTPGKTRTEVVFAALVRQQLLSRGAHGEDRRLWRVDNRGEVLDAHHAEIRDGEGASLKITHVSEISSAENSTNVCDN